MASTSEEDVEKARVAGETVSNETREEIRNTTLVQLSGLNFGLVGKELAAELFMDIAFSSPYVGLVHPQNAPCWTSFASHHNTGYQSTHQTRARQRPFMMMHLRTLLPTWSTKMTR
jgi:hypothetical protein